MLGRAANHSSPIGGLVVADCCVNDSEMLEAFIPKQKNARKQIAKLEAETKAVADHPISACSLVTRPKYPPWYPTTRPLNQKSMNVIQ